ncbi:MAG TPA: SDR family NAD(P)-dependent oxidoreductase [Planctomycetota bacterium]|nr:SDR family NAD(P)-dependent oxidoreductase [Planctomycetota bacterium]
MPGEPGSGPGADAPLRGRVAVITGASSGIGAATAARLASLGMAVVLGARRTERVEALARQLAAAHGVRALGLPLDVREAESVDAFASAAQDFAGAEGVAALVNNAGLARGVARIPAATAQDEAGWEQMFAVNVLGLLRVTRRFVPGMVAADRGHVVNLGSLAGLETYEGGSVYCATKASVRVISKALRLELLGTAVRVTCINPGMVAGNDFSLVRLGSEEKAAAVYAGMTPLTSQDIAATIGWVLAQPAHVSIEELNLQPVDQASAQKVHRRPQG